MVYLIFY